MIFSKNILENKPGNKIVYDVKCSKHLENIIIENKGTPILSRTGHSFIKESIIKNNAILGGEMSGHIFFNDKWFGFDDGIYASLRFLEICSSYDELQSVINDLPKSITTPEINIKFEGNNHFTFMDLFVKLTKFEGAEIVNIDGMKIIYSFGWGLIRCSNTSSNLVLRFEADDEKSLNKIKTIMKNAMLKIDKNLDIPF
jgi:phosphomannomutase